jgi:hypothetical protein
MVDTCRAYIISCPNRVWICSVWAADEGHLDMLHGRGCIQRGTACLPRRCMPLGSHRERPLTDFAQPLSRFSTFALMEHCSHIILYCPPRQRTRYKQICLSQSSVQVCHCWPSRASHGNIAETASEVQLHVHRLECSKQKH